MRDLWMGLLIFVIVVIWYQGVEHYENYQLAKGEAVARFLAYHHNLDVAPEDARFFNVEITTFSITVEELDIFMP